LLLIALVIGLIYALPNIYGEVPSVQVSSPTAGVALTQSDLSNVKALLKQDKIVYKSIELASKSVLVRFNSINDQQKASEDLKEHFGSKYLVAISLAPAAPKWLLDLGAVPMRLGLDLRGGVHFLLQVDINAVLKQRLQADVRNVAQDLRGKDLRYSGISLQKGNKIVVNFRKDGVADQASSELSSTYPSFNWTTSSNGLSLTGELTPSALHQVSQYTVDQTIATLKRRVNELGVSEATVQQQGAERVAVDLPGVQDATQAKNLLGKTATLEFHLEDTTHDAMVAAQGVAPPGDTLYTYEGRPVLLKNQVVLTGNSITSATAAFDQAGQPAVNIKIAGEGESNFYHITGQNIGKPLAVVYIQTKSHPVTINGKKHIVYKKEKRVINIATIQSALGSPFQVMGLPSMAEAQNLAMLLRAGALIAPVTIVAEENVGPSMGAKNIQMGMESVGVGLLLVVLFMAFYYRFFGVIADMALVLNLIFIVAIMSMVGAVLSFPGIAAMVLTLGMAVDANVLIFERIREELRAGVAVQAAIHAGYEKAFITIVDANVTSLIAAIVLFSLGTGSIKGFALTLTIGLVTSMFTSVVYTRAVVNFIYGKKKLKSLSIGIKPRQARTAANEGGK
jgi:preprotein translocase subunit SecD